MSRSARIKTLTIVLENLQETILNSISASSKQIESIVKNIRGSLDSLRNYNENSSILRRLIWNVIPRYKR